MLLLPVVSAATALGVVGTLVFTLLAAGAYLSFLLFIDWSQCDIGRRRSAHWLRVVFLAMVGNLANTLAEDLRVQSEKHRRTAEQLAEANVHIQRGGGSGAPLRPPGGAGPAFRRPGARAAQSAGHHQGVGGNAAAATSAAENEVAREVAGFITSEVDRTNSLVTRFLQFARPLAAAPGQRRPGADARPRRRHWWSARRPGSPIYRNYAPEIPPFPFDAELMERVFYNLVLNAAQATAPGGAVTVKTRAAGGTAEIAVIDRGAGIDPKQLDTIFNPFFTTKPQGVGLGLAIVSKIVDEHGGKIAVESEPGKGSIFRVLLPMDAPSRANPSA